MSRAYWSSAAPSSSIWVRAATCLDWPTRPTTSGGELGEHLRQPPGLFPDPHDVHGHGREGLGFVQRAGDPGPSPDAVPDALDGPAQDLVPRQLADHAERGQDRHAALEEGAED